MLGPAARAALPRLQQYQMQPTALRANAAAALETVLFLTKLFQEERTIRFFPFFAHPSLLYPFRESCVHG